MPEFCLICCGIVCTTTGSEAKFNVDVGIGFRGSRTAGNILYNCELDVSRIAYDREQFGVLVNYYYFAGRVRLEIHLYSYGVTSRSSLVTWSLHYKYTYNFSFLCL